FHLACDASNDEAVLRLRERKGRVDKPFALMAPDLDTVSRFAWVSQAEARLLTGRERPIVLLRKKENAALSAAVAPGNPYVGFMLPYTPLHYLLLDFPPDLREKMAASVLVMTSGNYSDEPIVKDNEEARRRLAGLADAFLMHDREIHMHCDDSVIRVFRERELPIRRSRGYAPFPVRLPFGLPPTLAVGGELKSTFCLIRDDYAFMSQHIGDMENLETLEAFARAQSHFRHIFRVEPEVVVADLHPRYLSTRWAQEHSPAGALVQVQHHHAHIAAVMAEHGLEGNEPVIGFSFDGTGYGTDGAIWGGELLLADYDGFRRLAHLEYFPLPGGDAAIRRPYRVALAQLWAAGIPWSADIPSLRACPAEEQRILERQLARSIHTVPCSSMGRLFDAVASLADVRHTITYEAQAAIELEALADGDTGAGYAFALPDELDPTATRTIGVAPVLAAVVADVRAGVPAAVIAARFHQAVAELILRLSLAVRRAAGYNTVALSGGVFQNITLLEQACRRLEDAGFQVLYHHLVPPNDGGLALGQAVIGGRVHLRSRKSS
ncbi:MAG: carbamoyltransferase HypF, partial [Caldilineae bacterium]